MNYLFFDKGCVFVTDDPFVFNLVLGHYAFVKFYPNFDSLVSNFDSSCPSAIILADYYYDKFINSDLCFTLFYVNDYSDFLDIINSN